MILSVSVSIPAVFVVILARTLAVESFNHGPVMNCNVNRIGSSSRSRLFPRRTFSDSSQGRGELPLRIPSSGAPTEPTRSTKTVFFSTASDYISSLSSPTTSSSLPSISLSSPTTLTPNAERGVNVSYNPNKGYEPSKIINHQKLVKEKDSLDKFANDVTRVLKEIHFEEEDKTVPALFRSKLLSMTNIWTVEMWNMHTSRWRFFRYIRTFPTSRIFVRTLPQLSILVLWSVLAISLNAQKKSITQWMHIPISALSLVSTFVGALLTLRSNQGLNRLAEGRDAWGMLMIWTRDTAQILSAYVYPKDPELGLLAARNLSIFGWLLKSRLRDRPEDDDDLIRTMLPNESDSAYVISQRKRPVALIARIRQIVANMAQRGLLSVPEHRSLESNLNSLNRMYGICERIRGSPIPPLYTAHTSRLLVFYLLFLPLAFHGNQARRLVTVLATGVVGFCMLGLDEISHVLEQPFGVMPLYQLSKNSMRDVADAFVCQPPPLSSSETDDKGKGMARDNSSYPFYADSNRQPSYW